MSSGTASILDTRPETLSFTRDLYTRSLTAKYLQKFIFFLLNFIRTMHSGEIVPSFHSAFVSHSPRGSSQSESAFFAMWVPLLRNSDLPYLACSGSSSISWSANLRSGVMIFFASLLQATGLPALSRGGRGESFRPYPGPKGGTDGKFGWWCAAKAYSCVWVPCVCAVLLSLFLNLNSEKSNKARQYIYRYEVNQK